MTKTSSARIREALEPLHGDRRTDFVVGQVERLVRLASGIDEEKLERLLKKKGELGALIELLAAENARDYHRGHDALAAARARGLAVQREALDAEGGALGAQEVADLLGISRQAVDQRRASGKLLAVDLGLRKNLYPRWQFTEGGILPGLEEVLAALSEHETSSWMCLRFFLAKNYRLDERRPLDVLRRGEVAEVVEAARAYGEQGGA